MLIEVSLFARSSINFLKLSDGQGQCRNGYTSAFFKRKKIDKGVLETYYDTATYQCVDGVLVSVMASKLILELRDKRVLWILDKHRATHNLS